MTGCALCGLPTPESSSTEEPVFCCTGCEQIYQSVGELPSDTTPTELDSRISDDESADSVAYLSVDGMHCATCELFLESLGRNHEGISTVTASYATDTLRVEYDPTVLDADALPRVFSRAGYEASTRTTQSSPRTSAPVARFLIGGGIFGMMGMVWYVLFLYPTYLGFTPVVSFGTFDKLYLLTQLWLFTAIVLFYTGFPILRGAYVSLRTGQPTMDLLVSTAAVGAFLYSSIAMILGHEHVYFDVTIAIILVVTAGNYYETRIKHRVTGFLSSVSDTRATSVRRADGDEVPYEAIDPGDRIRIRPGERIPFDGIITAGSAAVNEAVVSGESLPREKHPGDRVLGGSIVTDSPITIQVADDASSTIDRLIELLWSIQSTSSGTQRLADRLATVFVPLVLGISIVAFIGYLALGSSVTSAVLVMLTVVIVACPCALGLATPLAVASGVREAAVNGIVFASDAVFETADPIETVVLDKTGTLTQGEMTVLAVHTKQSMGRLLTRAAMLEEHSLHPIAAAIVRKADSFRADGGSLQAGTADVTDVEVVNRGVVGRIAGSEHRVGHPALFEAWGIPVSVRSQIQSIRDAGRIPVVVGWDETVKGVLAVGDAERENWREVTAALASQGIRVVVLTGDESGAVSQFEHDDSVDAVFAGVPPEGKAAMIRRVRQSEPVAMVGDGSNDAPALAAADIGIAVGRATDLAIDAADVVLLEDDLSRVLDVFALTRGTNRRIKQNLGWAFLYNSVAIPLALTGLLNPLFAAAAMASSSMLVVINSSRRLLS